MATHSRTGAGSPSHEMTAAGRIFGKRAREIQAQEGLTNLPANPWGGPPTSGNSTPLRENIPESPTGGFPDFTPLLAPETFSASRRARAGTLPSRFAPGGGILAGALGLPPGLTPKSTRPSPSHSPFKIPSPAAHEPADPLSSSSTLLSRLRAGSMPQRSPLTNASGTSSPFGPSVFSSWNPTGRDRASTLASIASVPSNGPSSPSQSQFSKEGTGDSDVHMRTLDYLGLAETPQQSRAQLVTPYIPTFAEYAKQASRIRSYSVNNQDKYADEESDGYDTLESNYAAHLQLQDQIAATHAAIRNHNLAVQALANQATLTRPRASTASVLDIPHTRALRNFYPTPSRLDNSLSAAEIVPENTVYENLAGGIGALSVNGAGSRNNGQLTMEEAGSDGPTSALWLGNIPTSTTTSTLTEMFKQHGPIKSARVLTHKNCGFVNFENVVDAVKARQSLNGQEIFPGAGPIRINFAKPPSSSNTPGHDGLFPSPSPDPFAQGNLTIPQTHPGSLSQNRGSSTLINGLANDAMPPVVQLRDMTQDILKCVRRFGASEEDTARISRTLFSAVEYADHVDEIPTIKEPTHTRVHDAPKLRDVRKKIDNQTLSLIEIETIANEMLPEIVELASDYLGNTVVQKLFEHCSDKLRDDMLAHIAPHLAEIGVHKNGTWAAQKIIEVCKTPQQMNLIVQNLHAYTVPLFLDQYGNYVLQGCLKFGAPYNDFIFESMLGKMWEISQGRYGARAMRACLESHYATKDQQRLLAAAVAVHGVQLATNANGALLLTWFLDTCTFPLRRTVLAPQLAPHLVLLCSHKVAYLTVLKVINQKAEAEARDTILKAMFFSANDHVLESILRDQACGSTLVFKVLTTPFFDENIRTQVLEIVKSVLLRIKAQPSQGYKRLMDEVGINTRGSSSRDHSQHNDRPRPASRQVSAQSQQGQAQLQNQGSTRFKTQTTENQSFYNPTSFDQVPFATVPRNEGMDNSMPQQFPAFNSQSHMYNGANGIAPMNLQQLQYQQAMLQRAAPQVPQFFPPLQVGFQGFQSPSPSIDGFRAHSAAGGSPAPPHVMHGNPGLLAAPGYALSMNSGAYGGYGNMYGMQQTPPYLPDNNRRQPRNARKQAQRSSANSQQY